MSGIVKHSEVARRCDEALRRAIDVALGGDGSRTDLNPSDYPEIAAHLCNKAFRSKGANK